MIATRALAPSLALALLLLLVVAPGGRAALERTVVWTAAVKSPSTPVPYPTAQAADSVVVVTGENRVLRLDAQGQPVFAYDLGDAINAVPACGDLDGDGQVEIVAGTVRGHIVALSGAGQLKWSYEFGHPFSDFANVVISPRAAGADVLIHGRDGWLVCLDGRGRHRWSFRVALEGHISAPAVADLDGDGQPEYVCGIDAGRVLAVTDTGRLLWEHAVPEEEFGREVAVVGDADRNGTPEVYILKAGATSAVFCLDGPTGKLRWTVPIGSKCYCALTLTDINGDGYDEVLVGTKYNQVIAYSRTGEQLWQQTLGGNGIFSTPIVADVNGDDRLEIVVGVRQVDTAGNSLFVLDTQGRLLGSYPHEGDANCAAVVADLDRDGRLEVVTCSGKSVIASRFGQPAKVGAAPWPCYRGNAFLNGCQLASRAGRAPAPAQAAPAAGLLPRSLQPVLGETSLTCSWTLPTPAQGVLEVTATGPENLRQVQAFRTTPEQQSVTISLPFGNAGRYALEARLLDTAERRVLAQDSRTYRYTPLSAEKRMVEAALAASQAAASGLPVSSPLAAGLEQRRLALGGMLASLTKSLQAAVQPGRPLPAAIFEQAAALRARATREQRFADFARQAGEGAADLLFVAWPDADPWDVADPRDQLPEHPASAASLSAWAYGNQREDFCLNLAPLGPEPFSVRVEPADLVGPGGATAPWERHLRLHQVVWMPTVHYPTPVPDMLPTLNPGRTLELAPGSFAQLWLVVDTKDLAPGPWQLKLHLQSLTMSAAAADVTLDLEVLPVALPYPYPWKMCNWAWPSSFPQPLRDQVIESLISHGSNVMYAPCPGRTCDALGRLVGKVDWTDLDSLVAKAKPGDPFLFFGSPPLAGPAGMPQESPLWKKAYRAWLQELTAHLAAIGIDRRHFAYYPVDEPGNSGHTGIEQLIAAAKVLREADPRAPIYADPAGGAYTLEWIQELDPWVDVWAPASGLSSRPEFHQVISARNRQVWMYDAPGNVRMLSPLGFYRRQPWAALRNGARGSGFWVYHYSDLWSVGRTQEPDWGAVYIDRDAVVESRRWRAAHDGVQDVTAIILLDEAVAQAQQLGIAPDLCSQAQAARAAALAEVTPSEDSYRLELSVLERHRRQIADLLVALRQALAAVKQ